MITVYFSEDERANADAFLAEFGDKIREFLASHGGGSFRALISEDYEVEPADPAELNAA